MMGNSGQTCSAPSRMLVPAARMAEASELAAAAAAGVTVGDPNGGVAPRPRGLGHPVREDPGAHPEGHRRGRHSGRGGTGRPDGLAKGYYVKPTVFADVTNDMTIAREEIFGPVLTIIGYDDLDDAVEIANDTEYGLAGYVSGEDLDTARAVASRIRAGWVAINSGFDFNSAFGGYKQSGNGREWGDIGFHEYLETKSILAPAGASEATGKAAGASEATGTAGAQ